MLFVYTNKIWGHSKYNPVFLYCSCVNDLLCETSKEMILFFGDDTDVISIDVLGEIAEDKMNQSLK